MKKCWTIVLALSLLLGTCAYPLPVGAEAPAPGTNLLKGGYGWTYNSSWGNGGDAVDGDMATSSRVNRTKADSYIAVAMPGSSGVPEFNKVVLHFNKKDDFSPAQFTLMSYTSAGAADPGMDAGGTVTASAGQSFHYESWTTGKWEDNPTKKDGNFYRYASGSNPSGANLLEGEQTIAAYTEADGALPNKVTYELAQPVTGRIFNFLYTYPEGVASNTIFGLYELEAYYVTPAEARWDDSGAALTAPAEGEAPVTEALPAYSVYDQLGDKLGENLLQAFPGTLELNGNYDGVTLEGGQITITSACTAASIELLYKATEGPGGTQVCEQTLSIPVQSNANPAVSALKEAKTALAWDLLSYQQQTGVTKHLHLPVAQNGALTIGGKTYEGMGIAWRSDKENVISPQGAVTQQETDTEVILTATLSLNDADGILQTQEATFPITVLAQGTAVNLMCGGYGWNNGWGKTFQAVDGDMGTAYDIGSHSLQPTGYSGVLKTAGGAVETYNKLVCYVKNPQACNGYEVTGYTVIAQDPGSETKLKPDFTGAEGKLELVTKAQTADMGTTLEDKDKMVWEFTQPKQSRYFDLNLYNQQNPGAGIGFYEFEVYYAAPEDVRWDDGDVTISKPAPGQPYESALPAYSVYDQLGDKLGENLQAAFPGTLTLKENYPGVTLEGGTLRVTSDFAGNTIAFLYKAVDGRGTVMLEKTINIAVKDEISATIAYLEQQIPKTAAENITLPTSYEFEPGKTVSISWTSNSEYITADGTVTRPPYETGDQDVILTASITPSGGGAVQTKDFTVKVLKLDNAAKVTLDAAKAALVWEVLSHGEPKTAVTRDLALPMAADGTLTIAGQDFPGVDISWQSSDETVISTTGAVTRKHGGGRSTLTATLSIDGGGAEPLTDTVVFTDIVVLALGAEHNLVYGSYSWALWGHWNNALDGNTATRSGIGKHSAQDPYSVAFVTNSKQAEKYNKLVLFLNPEALTSFQLAGYTAGLNDPGNSTNLKPAVTNPEGTVELITKAKGEELLAEAAQNQDNYGRVVVNLDAPQQSKYFLFGWWNMHNQNAGGLYEFEAYYAKPARVAWQDPDNISMVIPRAGGAATSYGLPAYKVYDELGDDVPAGFTGTWTLADSYAGVTLEDGTITLDSGCNVNEIALTYTATDTSDGSTCLTQQLSIPLEPASDDYVDVMAAAAYLETQIPETATQDITLPDSYTGIGNVRISWTTSNETYLTAGGQVTRPSGAVGDVTVTLTATISCGTETISRDYKVKVLAREAAEEEKMLAQAGAALTWDAISDQQQTAVAKALLLPRAQSGTLTIGGNSYPGMSVTWTSSNPQVVSNKGNVTRQNTDTNVTLTATLAMGSGAERYTLDVPIELTVVAAGTVTGTKNIMAGGYGWTTGGWGNASYAVDGRRDNPWSLGEHSTGTIAGGLKTASGELEKYNRVDVYFYLTNHLMGYDVTGYTQCSSDPGKGTNVTFDGGTGATPVIAYDPEDPSTVPDGEGKVSRRFEAAKQSRYFGVTLTNSEKDANNSNNTGVYELEAYYLTPYNVRWNDDTVAMYRPLNAGETISFDLPAYTVYDEFGDELVDKSFTGEWTFAEPYAGVTLSDGKLHFTSACTVNEIDLVYTSGDGEKTYLQQVMTIPVGDVTGDYYTMMEVADYLDTLVPPQATGNLNLVTSKDGVTVVWSSSDEAVVRTDGTVTRPAYGEEDKSVTLTAALSIGAFNYTKTFTVRVIQNATEEQIALLDANRIDLGASGVVSSNLTLPAAGYYGSAITWVSDKPNVISNSGVFTLTESTGSSTKVVLTATVTYQGKTVKKDFTVYAKTTPSGGGGPGGGGGGGGRGSGGKTVEGSTSVNTPQPPLTDQQLEQGLFTDVPSGYWAKEFVETLAERKIISGVDSGRFEPEREITREEFLKLIVTAFGFTLKPGETAFTDVADGAWYADYVVTAYKEGLVTGVSETAFGIGQSITRQDAAVILERVLTKLGTEYIGAGKAYADTSDIAAYAANAVENLTMIGIMQGDDNGNFLPQQHTSRAEAAKIIYAAMQQGGLL